MILCDTNIHTEVYRKNAAMVAILERIGYQNIVVSDIIRGELLYGARNKTERQVIRKSLMMFTSLPVLPAISAMAVDLVDKYCLSHKLHIVDAQIAATAIYHNIELYTLNIKDFIFIPEVQLFQPL